MSDNNKPLKVAFDGKRALFNFTGLGNYCRYALGALSEFAPGSDYRVYSHKDPAKSKADDVKRMPGISIVTPSGSYGRRFPRLWRHYGGLAPQLKADGIDLYHGLSNELPLDIARAGIPSVVTIHDLIFRTIPENYKAVDRRLYDFKFSRAARNATRIIAISERTKADIIRFYGIDPAKIDVIYQGCDPIFNRSYAESTAAEVREAYSLPEKFIVMIGTVEQRKNQLLAVEALALLPDDVSLVIAGRERNSYGGLLRRRIAELGLENRVRILSGVPTSHLPALYSLAVAAAYPSRYEGFGLPVIEAINSGTPVIAATGSCLEEAGGEGAAYVDPDSPAEFAEAARRIMADKELRREMVERGQAHTARFNRRTFALQLTETYRKAIAEFNAARAKRSGGKK